MLMSCIYYLELYRKSLKQNIDLRYKQHGMLVEWGSDLLSLIGGKGGIRTLVKGEPLNRISSPAHSTTLPPFLEEAAIIPIGRVFTKQFINEPIYRVKESFIDFNN